MLIKLIELIWIKFNKLDFGANPEYSSEEMFAVSTIGLSTSII